MKKKNRALLVGGVALSIVLGGLYESWNRAQIAEAATSSGSSSIQAGRAVYEQHCIACHGVDGVGLGGKIPNISTKYRTVKTPYDRAYSFISSNMPENAPGSLSESDYRAVVKYVLSLNGVPTDFADIEGHWAQSEIIDLQDRRYIDGYTVQGQLLFKPEQPITRAEFVRYLIKAKEFYLSNDTKSSFVDAAKFKTDAVYIATAVENGLINGFPDGTFKPEQPIKRSEIAAILVRSELLQAESGVFFEDVPIDHWANPYVLATVNARLFQGYPDGKFLPNKDIKRAEATTVIARLLNSKR